MNTHPTEVELALLAGGECGVVTQFFLNRHVRKCERCLDTVAEFVMLRHNVAEQEPHLDWGRLEAEMRANIHLGLEAGECVRTPRQARPWNPRMAVAFASLMLLLGAGVLMRVPKAPSAHTQEANGQSTPASVLESTGSGLELRNGDSSLTILNRYGSVADQTVSAQGVIGARYVDAGGVTTNHVYLE
jgi:hypothetical protein